MSSEPSSDDRAAPAGGPEPSTKSSIPAPAMARTPAHGGETATIFTLTTFLSALLLFSIQPMFAKMVLPLLGGAPSVWAVAMCFFQGALLVGYCYAHLLDGWVPARTAGFVHLALIAAAFVCLPIALPAGWSEPPPGDPYLWQFGLFTVAVGLPFVAVAANAPLLQAWFSRTGHASSSDPYFMYAASNLGSLIALLGYPFLLEPLFGLSTVSRIWTAGFALLWLAIAACFFAMRRALLADAAGGATARTLDVTDRGARPTWANRLEWIGLALVPSALLTAFTTHIATDVASAPLIWVVPLSLYLLTFVLVFRERALIPMRLLLVLHVVTVILALLQLSQTQKDTWYISAETGVAAFFFSAMVAHRTLYEARPAARNLTEFYLYMSLGGVLGGLFAALVAPKMFAEVYEYPLLLALSFACRPGALRVNFRSKDEVLSLWLVLAGGILLFYWVPWSARATGWTFADYGTTAGLTLIYAIAVVALMVWPARQAVAAMFMCLAVAAMPSAVNRGDALEKRRSYFGVYRVSESGDGEFNVLTHGTTLHGAQRVRDTDGNPVLDTTPGTYYYPGSPMGKTIDKVREKLAGEGRLGHYGVVGVGSGSLACHSKPGEAWRFFEIDPTILEISGNPHNFSYLTQCQPKLDVVIGDARLTMAKQPDESFDLIIVDAFSSDAVPVHLMTAEALETYARKLKPDGIVLLHISNRYLDLATVLAATRPLVPELSGLLLSDDDADGSYASTTSTVGIFSKSADALKPFEGMDEAMDLSASPNMRGWTDDYSDILTPFLNRVLPKHSE